VGRGFKGTNLYIAYTETLKLNEVEQRFSPAWMPRRYALPQGRRAPEMPKECFYDY